MTANSIKLPIGLLIALVGFPQISETIYTPALPEVAHSLGTTPNAVEATLSIYFFGFALGVLLWGAISDYIGRKPTMLIGICLYGLFTILCGMVNSIEMLLTWRFFQAFGASVGSVITQTILRDAYTGTERAKLFSIISGALAFSPAVGPLLGGVISQYFGWESNFFFLAVLSGTLLWWSSCSLCETRPEHVDRQSLAGLKGLFIAMMTSRSLWGHVLLIGATNGVIFGFYQEAPFVFIEQIGISPGVYGCFGLLIAFATIAASRFSYRKSHKGALEMIRLGVFCTIFGAVFFLLLAILGALPRQAGIVYATLALFFTFFGIGLIIPNSLSSALKAYQSVAGTAGSIFGGCYYCFIAFFTLLLGSLHDGTTVPLPAYMVFLGFVMLLGSYLCREKEYLLAK